MPGIVGIIKKNINGDEEQIIQSMLAPMLHETFYTSGHFESPEHGFFIGFSSLEDSFSDCMPIFNETKDLVLFLTGETYTDKKIIDELKHQGHQFDSSNAFFIIHLYEEKGESFFRDLNGWYNGIILDLKNGTARLFNDRCGIRRIYYHERKDEFIFASEAKALLKAFPELREIDPNSIGELLTYDCVLKNRTYFKDIHLLPPASVWSFNKNVIKKNKYIDLSSFENQPIINEKQFFEELKDVYIRMLPKYFTGGPVGMSMTGGLDTRSILACIDLPPGELPCYTFGGTYKDIWDVRIAPKVAETCDQPHQTLRFDDNDLLKNYSSHVEKAIYISDGLEGVTKADVISFNKMAREIAPVRMTGKYGSQVLKGIVGFQERPPVNDLIEVDFRKHLERARINCSEIKIGHPLTFLFDSVIPFWWNGFLTLESSQVDVRSPFLDNDLIRIMYQAPDFKGDFGTDFQLNTIRQMKPELMAIPTTGSHGGNSPWPVSTIIKNWIKYTAILDKIHIREEIPFNMTHIVGKLDYILSPLHIDKLFMGLAEFRRYRVWFRDQLSEYIRSILLDNTTLNRPYWNKKYLIKIVEDHINGRGTYLREIRKALQIELTHRVLVESI